MVLYRTYRPQKLADLVGQEHVVGPLLKSLESGKIAHGYLFAGPRGTGKTSTARILAKAVNCSVYGLQSTDYSKKSSSQKSVDSRPTFGEPCNKCASCKAITDGSYLDLIEVDAASNRGIDEIRDLREKIRLSPVAGRFKVYIIDEVHMLTTEAFNALLKTLEEPPAHAIFILCTTEENKLPETIVSRLVRFNFKRANTTDLEKAIARVCKAEKIDIAKEALEAVVRAGDGSYRDALSVLEQVGRTGGKISEADVLGVIKISGHSQVLEFARLLVESNLPELASKLDEAGADLDMLAFNRELLLFFEKLLYFKIGTLNLEEVDPQYAQVYKEIDTEIGFDQLQNLLKVLLVAEGDMKYYPLPQISLLLAFTKWCGESGVGQRQSRFSNEKSSKGKGKEDIEDIERIKVTKDVEEIKESKKTVEIKGDVEAVQKEKPENSVSRENRKGKIKMEDIEANWGVFLARIRPVSPHILALLRSTRPISVDGDTLNLEVFFRLHKDRLEEPKIMDLLCNTFSQILESPVVFRMQLADRNSKPPPAVSKSNVSEPAGSQDVSRLAEEIFLK